MSSASQTVSIKTVAITGASRGIGAELARVVVARGWNAILIGRTKADLDAVEQSLGKPAQTLVVVGDVAKRSDVDAAVAAGVARFKSIDVWVNNAGQGISKKTELLTDDDFDSMMTINCKSVLYAMQAAMKHFRSKAEPEGQIINVSSLLGRFPSASFRSAYCAAKHAMNSLTETLRIDVTSEGLKKVFVCGFHPGVVSTEFGVRALHGGVDNRKIPGAQPVDEVANVILSMMDNPAQSSDVYSRPGYKNDMVAYYAAPDMAAHEAHVTQAMFKAAQAANQQRLAAAPAADAKPTDVKIA